MDRPGPKDVQKEEQSVVGKDSHFRADEERLVSRLNQVDVFGQMLRSQ